MDQSELDQAGQHYSQTERRADEASRSVMGWLKCHYMRQHLGDEFDGIVTAVMEFGLFITLTDLYVDGLVHVRHMGDDYFAFDASSQTLNGQNHGQRFGLGDKVRIKVAGVNLDDRKIDFELIRQLSSQGRAVRERAPRVNGNAPPPKTARRGGGNPNSTARRRAKPVTPELAVSPPVDVVVQAKPRKGKAKKPKSAKEKASKKAKEKKRKANAKRKAD
jgi:ribonuclease R